MKIYRQGDVLLVEKSIPVDARRVSVDGNRIILAHGEVTGHAHAIYSPEKARKFEASEMTFLEVLESVKLEHEEHEEHVIPVGTYQVIIQSEYTPEEFRNVAD